MRYNEEAINHLWNKLPQKGGHFFARLEHKIDSLKAIIGNVVVVNRFGRAKKAHASISVSFVVGRIGKWRLLWQYYYGIKVTFGLHRHQTTASDNMLFTSRQYSLNLLFFMNHQTP